MKEIIEDIYYTIKVKAMIYRWHTEQFLFGRYINWYNEPDQYYFHRHKNHDKYYWKTKLKLLDKQI
jgi:hypothetical protein